MTAILFFILLYVNTGLLFASSAYNIGLFRKIHWTAQVLLWPLLSLIYICIEQKILP